MNLNTKRRRDPLLVTVPPLGDHVRFNSIFTMLTNLGRLPQFIQVENSDPKTERKIVVVLQNDFIVELLVPNLLTFCAHSCCIYIGAKAKRR